MTSSDNTLVEAMHAAMRSDRGDIVSAQAALQALCTHVGLTVEVLEMIRRGEAVVVKQSFEGFYLAECVYWEGSFPKSETKYLCTDHIQLNTPIERREG